MKKIYKKEFTLSELIANSFKLYIDNFLMIFWVTLIVYFPLQLIMTFLPETVGLATIFRISTFYEGFIGIISTMAIVYLVKNRIDEKKIGLKELFTAATSRWGSAIYTNIIAGVMLLGLFLLLVIPGIIYFVYWYFIVYVVILHDKSGKEALNYSKALVKGRWWKVFLLPISLFILLFILSVIVGIAFNLLFPLFLGKLIGGVVTDLLFAFSTTLFAVWFINLDRKNLTSSQAHRSKAKKARS